MRTTSYGITSRIRSSRRSCCWESAAEVRLYDASPPVVDEKRDVLSRVYAVTFDDQGSKTTFFVSMTLERMIDKSQQALWRIINVTGGVRPSSWLD